MEQIYQIQMRTPIGDRWGTMTVVIDGRRVSGRMNLLGQAQPFEGEMDSYGNCQITGTLTTLVRVFRFTARGKILADYLELVMPDGRNYFRITGTPCGKEKSDT